MIDHDQLLKEVLHFSFGDLLNLVVPIISQRLDLERIELLHEEFFTDLPEGRRRRLDLLARIPLRKTYEAEDPSVGSQLFHVEIEHRARREMRRRLSRYTMQILLRHDLAPITILLNLSGGKSGIYRTIHREQVGGLTLLCFHYHVFGVAGCLAQEYLRRPEPLAWALAALMRPGEWSLARQKIECLRRLTGVPLDDARRFLLVNLVETYLHLEGHDLEEYHAMLAEKPNRPIADLEMTWADRLRAEGRAEARESLERLLLKQLELRFGPLSEGARQRLGSIGSSEELILLAERALEADSLQELGLG